ncbi:cobalamin biosynthesis protein [Paraglaciecola aquimarina]|uniref:Cobalamin biosynthesis protein n=1 Tax=Paraglaciecola algarum TaxID=3050085 RepID=A0ABS9D983_9ALTE|nr:cobalamin biosynthesis protein [Paraglaciecola sp. G1-23]MCF2949518.1 cobalamin biosynthesis protein [Paraglaciecola sp. G1-23]
MDKVLATIFSQELITFWLSLFTVLIERHMPWPDKYHPLSLWKLFTIRMADKVLPTKEFGAKQQKLSGSLAFIVLLVPVCVSIAVFLYMSVYPVFFEALLLLIALRYKNTQLVCHRLSKQIALDKKILARHTLQPIVLRETNQMSVLGLAKAACETLILRFNYQYCGVMFWFMLTGGVGAILYRLLYESSQSWNIKLTRFSNFGLSVKFLVTCLQWLPTLLSGFSLALASLTFRGLFALSKVKTLLDIRGYILNVGGACLNIELAGPAIYQQHKIRTIKCGGHKQVILVDIKRVQNLVNLAIYLWLAVSFLIYALLYAAAQ